jgi:hypothetical protein
MRIAAECGRWRCEWVLERVCEWGMGVEGRSIQFGCKVGPKERVRGGVGEG